LPQHNGRSSYKQRPGRRLECEVSSKPRRGIGCAKLPRGQRSQSVLGAFMFLQRRVILLLGALCARLPNSGPWSVRKPIRPGRVITVSQQKQTLMCKASGNPSGRSGSHRRPVATAWSVPPATGPTRVGTGPNSFLALVIGDENPPRPCQAECQKVPPSQRSAVGDAPISNRRVVSTENSRIQPVVGSLN
jgi:hypothetical protein